MQYQQSNNKILKTHISNVQLVSLVILLKQCINARPNTLIRFYKSIYGIDTESLIQFNQKLIQEFVNRAELQNIIAMKQLFHNGFF